jgi:Domain of unknown function (DUF222)
MSSWVEPDGHTLEAMTPAEREACWRELDRERVQVEARLARFTHRLGDNGFHLVDGHRSMRGFARAACNWSTSEAARFEQLGRLLARFPQVADAVDTGGLGSPQLRLLAKVAANPRVGDQLDDAIELLVAQACSLEFDDLVIAVARWESLADEDGAGDRHERAHRNRSANVHVGEYGFELDAKGTTAVGVQMKEVLDAFTHSELLHDWEAGVAEHGDEMCPARLARSDPQRRADALHAIFLAATGGSAATGAATGANLTVNLVIGYDRFQRELTSMLGGQPAPVDVSDLCQPSETVDGYQLDPRDVLVAAAMGHVRRVVVDSAGVVVDVGRRQRLFTGPLRDAVMLSSPRCVWPGCCRPTTRCQADHMVPHADDGPTSTSNGAPLCGHHNRWKTSGYTTHRDRNGRWHHHRPDGTEIGWRSDMHTTQVQAKLDWQLEHLTLDELVAA